MATAAKSNDKLPASLLKVAKHVGELITHSGYDSLLGEIWVAMIMHEGPVTAGRAAAALGKKEPKVRDALLEMERWGAVRRAATPDGADGWSPELNPLKFTIKVLKEREEPAIRELEALLQEANRDSSVSQFARGRVRLLEEIIHLTRVIFEIMITIFQFDAPVIKRVRDTISTFTSGVGGVLGSLARFGRK
jgi:DNA-binding transcriptional regulator GbsR (MarR family)